jgi:hypothetical protein
MDGATNAMQSRLMLLGKQQGQPRLGMYDYTKGICRLCTEQDRQQEQE